MRLSEELGSTLRANSLVRYGVVTDIAVSTGVLTVRIGGENITDIVWLSTYTPIVGHRVACLRSGNGWIALGRVEGRATAYQEPRTIALKPTGNWSRSRLVQGESWDGFVGDTYTSPPMLEVNPPVLVPDAPWGSGKYYAGVGLTYQGLAMPPRGDGGLANYHPGLTYHAFALAWPPLATALPSGAVITDVSLVLRYPTNHRFGAANPSPVIHGHAMTPSTNLSGELPHTATPLPYVPGFTNWRAGVLPKGTRGVYTLPANWVTALASGTLTGLAFDSSDPEDAVPFDDFYSPWDASNPNANRRLTFDNLDLRVTYVSPVVEEAA